MKVELPNTNVLIGGGVLSGVNHGRHQIQINLANTTHLFFNYSLFTFILQNHQDYCSI